MFEIKKGTKQGDPLFGLLFNTVLQNALKEVTQRWQKKKGIGIYLSDQDHDCLTNMRFADDVLLFTTSKEQLQKMMYELKESTDKVGLRIHSGKTKVLSNLSSISPDSKKEMQIDDIFFEIPTRSESVRYLGQLISFQQQETTEIKNRIRTAWSTFHKYRQELTSKNYMLKHRLRLFDAAIRRYATHREHGHTPKSTKECYNRRNAKCSVSSYKKEDTKRLRITKFRTAKT